MTLKYPHTIVQLGKNLEGSIFINNTLKCSSKLTPNSIFRQWVPRVDISSYMFSLLFLWRCKILFCPHLCETFRCNFLTNNGFQAQLRASPSLNPAVLSSLLLIRLAAGCHLNQSIQFQTRVQFLTWFNYWQKVVILCKMRNAVQLTCHRRICVCFLSRFIKCFNVSKQLHSDNYLRRVQEKKDPVYISSCIFGKGVPIFTIFADMFLSYPLIQRHSAGSRHPWIHYCVIAYVKTQNYGWPMPL